MKEDIKNVIQHCESCQRNKLVRKKNKEPMVITFMVLMVTYGNNTSKEPFEKVALDNVGPLIITESGNKYILTFC